MAKQTAELIEITENKEEIARACAIAQASLNEKGIQITQAAVIATVAYDFLRAVSVVLAKNKSEDEDVEINFAHLYTFGVNYRAGADGEKDGNFVPYAEVGPIIKRIVKADDATEEE